MRTLGMIFKAAFVAISFYSVKKILDRVPEPFRTPVVYALRACVYLTVLLIVFSFLSGRAAILSESLDLPGLVTNFIIGIFFIVSLVVSLFTMAICEAVYRKASELAQATSGAVDKTKEAVTQSKNNVVGGFNKTKQAVVKAGEVVINAGGSVYDFSKDIAVGGIEKISEFGGKTIQKGEEIIRENKPKAEKAWGKVKEGSHVVVEVGTKVTKDVVATTTKLVNNIKHKKKDEEE